MLDKRSTYALAPVIRMNRHLLDMGIAVQRLGQQIADRPIEVVDGDPGAAVAHVGSQGLLGRQLVVGDVTPSRSAAKSRPEAASIPWRAADFVGPSFSDRGSLAPHRGLLTPARRLAVPAMSPEPGQQLGRQRASVAGGGVRSGRGPCCAYPE